jgi:hypothetical protein
VATPVAFPGFNLTLTPPPGEEANVVDLPVCAGEGRYVSCWMPSVEELAEILATGRIWLSVWGKPPVYVTGHRAEVL